MATRARLLVALVLGGRVAAEIDGLRRAFGSAQLERIPPHLTLVPPTNVAADALEAADGLVAAAAATSTAFRLLIGPGATFPDNTSVLYLSVSSPPELDVLRRALLTGPFTTRATSERAFVPHVTVVSRRQPFVDQALLGALSGYRSEVLVDSVDLLVQEEEVAQRPWRRRANFALRPPSTIGRGGREIRLSTGELPAATPVELAIRWVSDSKASDGGAGATERYCLAEIEGRPVGVITWTLDREVIRLVRHVVDPAHRGEGIGTQLLSFVESEGRARQCRRVLVSLPAGSDAARYYEGRGYRVEEAGSTLLSRPL